MQKIRVGHFDDLVITRRVSLDLRVPAVLTKKLTSFTAKEGARPTASRDKSVVVRRVIRGMTTKKR